MINLKKIIEKTSYVIVNNKLFIRGNNNKFLRIKQKLPEFINDIEELDNYDYLYKKKKTK